MKKNTIIALIIIVIAVALVWQYSPTGNQGPGLPGGVKFVLGRVIRTEASKIYFSASGGGGKTAIISDSTELKKQVKEAEGVKAVDAQLSDFVKGVNIVVFHTKEPKGNDYRATKVQIIDY